MESGSMAADTAAPATERPDDWGAGEKGLKANAIGYVSNIVIGVASTAPGYSLAATLGFIVAVPGVGLQAPAVLLVSFVPMLCIAFGYRYMNRADPDCGTTFAWVTRAMGPHLGWLVGLGDRRRRHHRDGEPRADRRASTRSCSSAGRRRPTRTLAVTIVGVVWIAVMTWICVIGIELNAKTQRWLLTAEVVTLAIFAVVALVKVYVGLAAGLDHTRPRVAEPVPDQLVQRARSTASCSASSSTGGGTAASRSTRSPRTRPTAPARRPSSRRSCSC